MSVANPVVLVIEDEVSMRDGLESALKKAGYKVKMTATLQEGLAAMARGGIEVILTDVTLPDGSGLDVLTRAKTLPERPSVLLMTASGTTDLAVEAMKLGAFYYITKPFKLDELNVLVKRALEEQSLRRDNQTLKRDSKKSYSVESILGQAPNMKKLYDLIERVSNTKTNVLVTGESGTGKELIARAIHFGGHLKDKPFVTVNCGAIPETLMESEMFGHRRGSFTGAIADKDGLFEMADTGTIFLDEVGELPLSIQVKLLRVLQDRSFRAVGGTDTRKVDVRVIAATNRNLEDMVAKGEFREDLYYRLNVINIHSPPLRDRKSDIPVLLESFLKKYCNGLSKSITGISPEATQILLNYNYPGNIRELQNIVERAVALEGGSQISLESLPISVQQYIEKATTKIGSASTAKKILPAVTTNTPLATASQAPAVSGAEHSSDLFFQGPVDLERIVGDLEKKYILQALEKTGGIKKDAAKLLGITFRSLRYRITKYEIQDSENDVDGDD